MSLLQKTSVAGARQVASGAFLAHGLQSYQATFLLLERSMLADARNVVRSIVETAGDHRWTRIPPRYATSPCGREGEPKAATFRGRAPHAKARKARPGTSRK